MIFISNPNELLPATLATVRKWMPDLPVKVLFSNADISTDPQLLTVPEDVDTHGLTDIRLDTLYKDFQALGLKTGYVIKSGVLITRDFRDELTALPRWPDISWAYSPQFLYWRTFGHRAAYRSLGLGPAQLVRDAVTVIRVDRPLVPNDAMELNRTLFWGTDPLLDAYLSAGSVLKHAWFAEQAALVDFGDILLDPEPSMRMCCSAPLEAYEPYLEDLAARLPEGDSSRLQRLIARSKLVQPLREHYAPLQVARTRYSPTSC